MSFLKGVLTEGHPRTWVIWSHMHKNQSRGAELKDFSSNKSKEAKNFQFWHPGNLLDTGEPGSPEKVVKGGVTTIKSAFFGSIFSYFPKFRPGNAFPGIFGAGYG